MVRMTTVRKRLALMAVFDGGGGQSREGGGAGVRGPSDRLPLVDWIRRSDQKERKGSTLRAHVRWSDRIGRGWRKVNQSRSCHDDVEVALRLFRFPMRRKVSEEVKQWSALDKQGGARTEGQRKIRQEIYGSRSINLRTQVEMVKSSRLSASVKRVSQSEGQEQEQSYIIVRTAKRSRDGSSSAGWRRKRPKAPALHNRQ